MTWGGINDKFSFLDELSLKPETGQSSGRQIQSSSRVPLQQWDACRHCFIYLNCYSHFIKVQKIGLGPAILGMRVNWPSLLSLYCVLGARTAHRHFELERLSLPNLQCTERDMEIWRDKGNRERERKAGEHTNSVPTVNQVWFLALWFWPRK